MSASSESGLINAKGIRTAKRGSGRPSQRRWLSMISASECGAAPTRSNDPALPARSASARRTASTKSASATHWIGPLPVGSIRTSGRPAAARSSSLPPKPLRPITSPGRRIVPVTPAAAIARSARALVRMKSVLAVSAPAAEMWTICTAGAAAAAAAKVRIARSCTSSRSSRRPLCNAPLALTTTAMPSRSGDQSAGSAIRRKSQKTHSAPGSTRLPKERSRPEARSS